MRPCAAIVTIGSELVDGRLVDTNANRLDERLRRLGFVVAFHVSAGDRPDDIDAALNFVVTRAPVVIVSGGLGPTEDDITRDAMARLSGTPLRENAEAKAHVLGIFEAFGRDMPPNNEKQALMPEGSRVLSNRAGTAFGFRVDVGEPQTSFFVVPGVPRELEIMFDEQVAPQLVERARALGAPTWASDEIYCFGMSESALDLAIANLCRDADPSVSLNVRDGQVRVTVTASGEDAEQAAACVRERLDAIVSRLGRRVVDRGGRDLPNRVAALLADSGLGLAMAESCTGGLCSSLLTAIPGVSRSLKESVVSYHNDSKVNRLGVDPDLLVCHGAVSAEVAQAMARGARVRAGVDVAVAITGVAGPSGGSQEKPVGRVYLAVDASPPGREPFREVVERSFGAQGRDRVRSLAAHTALDRLRLYLESQAEDG